MSLCYCDLHVHSCLSPCGDDDMTPGNIIGMSSLNGLNAVALTDHNSVKNCPSFFKMAEKFDIVPIAGVELTTAEDVHVVCLFRSLEAAMDFGDFIDTKRLLLKNKPNIFGNQIIVDENDVACDEESFLLLNAVEMSIEKAFDEVVKRNGVCYSAHIDRNSNGVISVLGDFPPTPQFTAFELRDECSLEDTVNKHSVLRRNKLVHVVSSDAHTLSDISEKRFAFEMDDDLTSPSEIRNRILDYLSGFVKVGHYNG